MVLFTAQTAVKTPPDKPETYSSESSNCRPLAVSRYFCRRLLGLSGIVISINSSLSAGNKYSFSKLSRPFRPSFAIISLRLKSPVRCCKSCSTCPVTCPVRCDLPRDLPCILLRLRPSPIDQTSRHSLSAFGKIKGRPEITALHAPFRCWNAGCFAGFLNTLDATPPSFNQPATEKRTGNIRVKRARRMLCTAIRLKRPIASLLRLSSPSLGTVTASQCMPCFFSHSSRHSRLNSVCWVSCITKLPKRYKACRHQ